MENQLRKMYAQFMDYSTLNKKDLMKLPFSKMIAKNEIEAEFIYLYYSQPPALEIISQLPQDIQDDLWRYVLRGCLKYNIEINSTIGNIGKKLKIPEINKIINEYAY